MSNNVASWCRLSDMLPLLIAEAFLDVCYGASRCTQLALRCEGTLSVTHLDFLSGDEAFFACRHCPDFHATAALCGGRDPARVVVTKITTVQLLVGWIPL